MLLRALLSDPNNFAAHIFKISANITLGIAYGYDVKSGQDPIVELADYTMKNITEGLQLKFLVNVFPILRFIPPWVPGAKFRQFATMCANLIQRLIHEPFNEAVERISSGEASPSFIQTVLSETTEGKDPQIMQDIKEIAAVIYAAGSETTASSVHGLVLQLVLHPEVQRRAQAELDDVLSSPNSSEFRLPSFNDREQLPYIDAILKETLRFHPALANGVPHGCMEDDIYRGWRIPKDSIIIPNAWAMLRDPALYKDPHTFRPERFLNEGSNVAEPDPAQNGTFGFGRRICPGRTLAENSIWLVAASLLACFTFEPIKDENGKDIQYTTLPLPGVFIHLPPFECSIIPRSEHVARAIQETAAHRSG